MADRAWVRQPEQSLGDRRSASRLACLTARAARPIARVASPIAKRTAGCSVHAPSFAKVATFAFPYPSGFFANSLSLPNATVIAKKPMLHFPILSSTVFHHKHL